MKNFTTSVTSKIITCFVCCKGRRYFECMTSPSVCFLFLFVILCSLCFRRSLLYTRFRRTLSLKTHFDYPSHRQIPFFCCRPPPDRSIPFCCSFGHSIFISFFPFSPSSTLTFFFSPLSFTLPYYGTSINAWFYRDPPRLVPSLC